ncbi:RagB/SusD family nutrient uptake outer membrane protein [Reichenbachiella sp. MALMAid0571]|uniref:RagB/SusD family nutrient uptake outer membrane protein n=1 Tax=Reichenbachiella sp. MALMAid0571 TaxID=3143939 RepID=UPI0032DF73FA
MKNRKSLLIKLSLLLSLWLPVVSCDTLEINDLNKGEEEDFFTTRESAFMAISGAYVLARRAIVTETSWALYSDVRSGLLKLNGPEAEELYNQELHSSQALFRTLKDWGRFYKAITQCNVVIEKIGDIPDFITQEEKNNIIAEAKFIRAFLYFNMARIWGDVPLVTKTSQIDAMSRTSEVNLLDFLITDLTAISAVLPDVYLTESGDEDFSSSITRATKGACYALLAHIHAWNGNYPLSLEAVNNLINLERYELHDLANDLSRVFEGNTIENIFVFSALSNFNSDFEYQDLNSDMFNDQVFFNGKLLSRIDPPTYSEVNALYSSSDARRTKYFSINDGTETVSYRKGNFPLVNSSFFRYSDILLLGAEATMVTNPSASEDFLNQVRNRAGLPDYVELDDGALEEAIFTERRRELYGEGQDFFDLVRFGKVSEKVSTISPADVRDGIIYWPISSEAFDNNALMTQNPFWN